MTTFGDFALVGCQWICAGVFGWFTAKRAVKATADAVVTTASAKVATAVATTTVMVAQNAVDKVAAVANDAAVQVASVAEIAAAKAADKVAAAAVASATRLAEAAELAARQLSVAADIASNVTAEKLAAAAGAGALDALNGTAKRVQHAEELLADLTTQISAIDTLLKNRTGRFDEIDSKLTKLNIPKTHKPRKKHAPS